MKARAGGLATVAVIIALVATGCAPPSTTATDTPVATGSGPLSEATLLPDPASAEGPVTAVISNDAITPLTPGAEPQLPVIVTSSDPSGARDVEIDDASRILALDISGSLAATVWSLGLGDRLVGRDMSTAFPGTEELPVVTSGAHAIDAESVLALRPTLLLTDGTIGPRDVIEQLRESGVDVVFLDNEPSFAGASALARDVGAALGLPAEGELLADTIEADVAAVSAEIRAILPTTLPRVAFLYLRGGSGVYYLFGAGSGADELVRELGAVDVAAEIGWVGEKPMTDEALIAAAPDVLIVMTEGLASVGGVDGLIAAQPAVGLTPAGERRRVIDMADDVVLGFGPRAAAVLEALARALYTVPAQ